MIAATIACAARARTPESAPAPAATKPAARTAPAEVPTPPEMPPFRESEEATSAQLGRALDEGKAVRREVEWVEDHESVASGEMAAGEYLVTYLVTPVDDYYDLEAAQSNFPAHHTTVMPGSAHVAVVVRDAADGRIVQGLTVHATLRSEGPSQDPGEEKSADLPYGWHPVLNRYGENIVLPSSPFTLSVRIAMPKYRRHDHTNGDRFDRDVLARFEHVTVSSDSLAAASQHLARGESREAMELAASEGSALDLPLAGMLRDPDASGSQIRSGDYKVSVVVQRARGDWEDRDGKLMFISPDSDIGPIAHMDVLVRDAASGRLVPGLSVRATILDSRKRAIDTYSMPFMWHPWMSHYGLNVPVPGNGRYTVRVRAEAPGFRRYGSSALKKFNKAIDAEVRGVRFVTAEK